MVSGTSATTFNPDGQITREQFALMMYNFAKKYLGIDVSVSTRLGDTFPDASDVSSWVGDAMTWAVEQGLITGKAVGNQRLLAPGGQASRAEAATMIMRFHKWLNGIEF